MIELQATIRNAQGIHCRPSAVIMKEVREYPGDIRIIKEHMECDLRSVMELLSMGLERGDTVTIRVDGPDEKRICRNLAVLFEREFDFPPRQG